MAKDCGDNSVRDCDRSCRPESPLFMTVASRRPTPIFRLTVFASTSFTKALTAVNVGENQDTAGTIAICRVTTLSRKRDGVRLLGCIEGESNRRAISHCIFHPENPLLAFHYQPAIGSSKVFIWCFQKDDSPDPSNFIVLGHDLLQVESSSASAQELPPSLQPRG
ncbi:hypothetical protein QBC42DRAFT_288337 [Cladorrhinum samala]|uniref:Uncharacterized protein n=1 Tax=Cladorrhinum samala TaxID=585594 RepID=A0AAV9HL17_9PEZI|nr:hypothetical protein QBC42DRAFT_288337 [Cladorrhinum samala]